MIVDTTWEDHFDTYGQIMELEAELGAGNLSETVGGKQLDIPTAAVIGEPSFGK